MGMSMYTTLKSRLAKLAPVLAAVAVVGTVAGFAAHKYFGGDCCVPGSSCCYPGSPCCHGAQLAQR